MTDSEAGSKPLEEIAILAEAAEPAEGSALASPVERAATLQERLAAVRLLAMDVDGVLTDGTIFWSARPQGGAVLETKSFSVKDGLGLSLARVVGLQIAWITGRTSPVVERRAVELGVTELHQWARNKALVLSQIMERHALSASSVAFVGDDLNDVPAFRLAGVRVAVADAVTEVRAAADWVTEAPGGRGAIREVVEAILRAQGRWEEAVEGFYRRLEQEETRLAGQ